MLEIEARLLASWELQVKPRVQAWRTRESRSFWSIHGPKKLDRKTNSKISLFFVIGANLINNSSLYCCSCKIRQNLNATSSWCCIFRPAFTCCPLQTLVKISFFCFCKILMQNDEWTVGVWAVGVCCSGALLPWCTLWMAYVKVMATYSNKGCLLFYWFRLD